MAFIRKLIVYLLLPLMVTAGCEKPKQQENELKGNPMVKLETTEGDIVLELYKDQAPVTVENFLNYTQNGFYDGTVFHRVIEGFMIQGGGYRKNMTRKPTKEAIVNEAYNGLSNERGTVAMARTSDPDSATSQFFINQSDTTQLDYVEGKNPGYAVFGKVVEGMDVVDRIAGVNTGIQNGMRDVPETPVIIDRVIILSEGE